MTRRAAILLCALAGACHDPMETPPCPLTTAISLQVFDAVTQQPISSGITVVYARRGDRVAKIDSATTPIAVGNAGGSYDLRLLKPGYSDWLVNGVDVRSSGCAVLTVDLKAFMQPAQ